MHCTTPYYRSNLLPAELLRLTDRPSGLNVLRHHLICFMSSVLVWSGIARGWLPAAPSRPHAEAIRFASLLRKVRGDRFIYKVEAI